MHIIKVPVAFDGLEVKGISRNAIFEKGLFVG